MFKMLQVLFMCILLLFAFNLCHCLGNEPWYAYQSGILNANREELVITDVVEENLQVPEGVRQWRSLNVGPVCYSIGLTGQGLVFLSATLNSTRNGFNITSTKIDFETTPSDTLLLHSRINGKPKTIVIIYFPDEVAMKWFELKDNNILHELWTWYLENPVQHINSFKIDNKDILLVIQRDTEGIVGTLYHVDLKLEKPRKRFLSTLDLLETVSSSAFNSHNGNYYLSIPRHTAGSLVTYKYEIDHFILYKTTRSPKISTATSFEIGFRSFLAVDGHNAGIFEFTDDGLLRQNIINSNLDGIHYWLPIPIQTFRDEVILLAQRALDHGTHRTYAVDVVINNGGSFEEHVDIPCYHLGEKLEQLTCLTHDSGIFGSSFISVGDQLGLIVPNETKNSELFVIRYEVKQLRHPKEKEISMLVKDKERLESLIESQIKEYEKLKNFQVDLFEPRLKIKKESETVTESRNANDDVSELRTRIETLGTEIIEIEEAVNNLVKNEENRTFDVVTVNGTVRFEGNAVIEEMNVNEIRGINADRVLEDIVRKNDIRRISGIKTFTDITVDNLNFTVSNGILADDLLSRQNGSIILNGDITFQELVTTGDMDVTSGVLNGENLLEEIIHFQDNYKGDLELEEVEIIDDFKVHTINEMNLASTVESSEMESISVSENVTVIFINGENFTKFIHELCLVNVRCGIPGNVTILGNINVKNPHSEYLNEVRFPQDYILTDSVSHANITGQKFFRNLLANEIRTRGTISGIDTQKLVTLSTDQAITGNMVFEDLELTEEINVTGNILGGHVDKILSNPTLETTRTIKANVNFKNLVVMGDLIIKNNFNGKSFSDLLNSLVYQDKETPIITASKEFSKGLDVRENLNIESNSINSLKLDALVTKDTDQNLDISILNGDVSIKNLIVLGTYDGKNITKLDESLVKLTGEQFVSSTLIFNDDLTVETLEITGKLNDLEAEEYLYTSGDQEVDAEVTFENIVAENLVIEGNFEGNISDFDLEDIGRRYLSYTKNQTVDAFYEIDDAKVEDLKAERVNGLKFKDLFDADRILTEAKQMIYKGNIEVGELVVQGHLKIDKVNGTNVSELFPKNPFEQGDVKNISIEGDMYVNQLEIRKLGSYIWDHLMDFLIFKNESSLLLNGLKTFTSGFTVNKLIETDEINNILLENILTKEGKQDVKGPLVIHGNLNFENVSVGESVNQATVKDILSRLQISDDGSYVIQGDMMFERVAYVNDLVIDGLLNGNNITQTISDLVYLDHDISLENLLVIQSPVGISGNLTVLGDANGVSFSDIVSRMAMINENGSIKGMVSFSEPVIIFNQLEIDEDLETRTLFRFNTQDWLDKAIFVNKGLLLGHYTFENITVQEELSALFINDVNMSAIVPLRSNQNIDYLEFGAVTPVNAIDVGGFVNGYYLPEEFENTVMADLDQVISTDVSFKNPLLIRENLTVETLNGIDPFTIVTTTTDQNLTSPYNFNSQCTVYSDVEIHGLLSGIDLRTWQNNIKTFSTEIQNIVGEWYVMGNITFNNDVASEVPIESLDIASVANEVEERRNYKYEFESGIIDDYNNLCTDIKYLHKRAKNQIYKFKYLDNLQHLSFRNDIQNVFFFEFQNRPYLLINEGNCTSHLFGFSENKFVLFDDDIETGLVEQMVPVYEEDIIYLIVRGSSTWKKTCKVEGTNVFSLTHKSLQLTYKMENQNLLQDSLVPGTFYGINPEGVIEYRIENNGVRKYRKWKISEENAAFVPRGLKTGLALRTGHKIILLDRTDLSDGNDLDLDVILRGKSTEIPNYFIPGRTGGDTLVITTGTESTRKTLLAVTTHEETIVRGRSDVIKIFEDALSGKLFDEIRTYKPSSMTSLEFDQGETLLVFLEDQRLLQVYEYKGLEGFKRRTSARIQGSKLVAMTLPMQGQRNYRKALGIINKNELHIIESVMTGNRIEDDFECDL